MTDLRQAAQQALEALEFDGFTPEDATHCHYTTRAIAALKAALEQPEQWDKPSDSFNEWWDSDYDDPANPFTEDSAAYWAWAGWQAAQRPWVGLTDEEVSELSMSRRYLVREVETKLKEKNT